jgi:hypothetical protein
METIFIKCGNLNFNSDIVLPLYVYNLDLVDLQSGETFYDVLNTFLIRLTLQSPKVNTQADG